MSESKYFIDSNIFLRVLAGDYKKQFEECTHFLESVKSGVIPAVTANVVLAEIQWALRSYYKMTKEDILLGLFSILSLQNLSITDSIDAFTAVKLFDTTSVKYIDAMIASQPAIQNGTMVVVSYDKDFDKLSVKRKEPGELI